MMDNHYPTLTSPFRIGNHLLRNRVLTAPMGLHALQGDELHPTEAIIAHYANKARGGAALVTCSGTAARHAVPDHDHLVYDLYIGHEQHYLAQMADAIHIYGALASMEIGGGPADPVWDVSAGAEVRGPGVPPGQCVISKEIPEDMLREIAENFGEQAFQLQKLGYDGVMIHMAYQNTLGARFLSPHCNHRTDEYGGSIENRARFPIECFDEIKRRCGRDFLIELRTSGAEPQFEDGIRIEDTVALAKLLEGHIDLLHLHAGDMGTAHPIGFEPDTPNLWMAERVKASGTSLAVVTIGGFQNPDEMERVISEGKADFISMARGWLADPNLMNKVYDNHAGDVVPCVKCMRCHDSACIEGKTFVCTVNPTMGLEHNLEKLVRTPERAKKVAVVGGGPAGMMAALTADKQGHNVTLYEKTGSLGGQLQFADYPDFKRSLAKFTHYLIAQIEKSGVKIILNAEVDADILAKAGYEAVIAAVGASPAVPPIPGVERATPAPAVFGHEDALPSPVVVIGGGQVGCEAALHLARLGKQVTILEMQAKLAPDGSPSYRGKLVRTLDAEKNVMTILGGRCESIGEQVVYTDADGAEHEIPAASVVLAAGMKANIDTVQALYDPRYRLYPVGDCEQARNVQKAVRAGWAAAINL